MEVLKEFEFVESPPKKRSRISKENGYYWEKKLSESQKIFARSFRYDKLEGYRIISEL